MNELVGFDEYVHSTYEYDKEWLNGVAIERNGGEFLHSLTLALLSSALFRHERDFIPLISVRVSASAQAVRVPDLTVLRQSAPRERMITRPPLLVIEVKAPEDTAALLSEKNSEYRAFGIEHVWVIDPYARVSYKGTDKGWISFEAANW